MGEPLTPRIQERELGSDSPGGSSHTELCQAPERLQSLPFAMEGRPATNNLCVLEAGPSASLGFQLTQLPDNCALQLSPNQAWGGRRYEARDPLPPTTLAQHSPKMGRLEQALRGARGGKTERNRGRMKKEGKGEGEEGTGREGRLPKCRAGQEGDGKSTTAKRQRCGEEREHSS